MLRTILLIAGILLGLMGALWLGQETGYFPYPSHSFMVGDTSWAYYGAALAAVGVIVIAISRRM